LDQDKHTAPFKPFLATAGFGGRNIAFCAFFQSMSEHD
jgi:hypothetical protein